MKFTLLLLAICLTLGMVWTNENISKKRPSSWTDYGMLGSKQIQTPYMSAKGGVKGHPLFRWATTTKEPSLRKGEYICGNKVCKLKSGEIPKGCEGRICQYPL